MSHDLSGAGRRWWDSGGVCHSRGVPPAGGLDAGTSKSNTATAAKSSFRYLILSLKTFFWLSLTVFWLVLFPSPNTFALQGEECEVDMECEGEVEGECEAEEACEDVQDREEAEDYPAVIVEEVPGANLAEEQGYSAQVVVYEDEAYLMQEVGDEQEVETEGEAGETLILLYLSEIWLNVSS